MSRATQRTPHAEFLTVGDAAGQLALPRSKFSRWLDANPKWIRLVEGGLRLVRKADLEEIGKAINKEKA